MTVITGVKWEEAWVSRREGLYGDVPVFFIGRPPPAARKTRKHSNGRAVARRAS
jgi:hypothetical protein